MKIRDRNKIRFFTDQSLEVERAQNFRARVARALIRAQTRAYVVKIEILARA